MAPVRRRTTALLVVAALLLAAVAGLTWFLVGEDDPAGEATAGAPTTLDPAAEPSGPDPTTAPGPTTASGAAPAGAEAGAGAGPGTSGPPAPPAPACAGVLSGAEAATALGTRRGQSDTGAHPPLTQNGDASFALTTKSRSEEASP